MVASLVATPDPVPVGTITRIDGTGFINRVTRLKLDGVIVGDSFRATKGIFTVGVLVSSTVKSQTLVAEQKQSGGSWSVVARLAPLLTFGPPGGVDTTPPVVTALQGNTITDVTFNVSFTTNEPSTTVVNYGLTNAYGSTTQSGTLVNTHNITVSGLTASTLYHWRIQTTDSKGNTTVSADQTITTLSGGVVDTTPPVISAVTVSSITSSSAVISWTTSEPSTGGVIYGLDATYGQSGPYDGSFTKTSHVCQLTSLTAGAVYHFKCVSTDAAGNIGLGVDTVFTATAVVAPPVLQTAIDNTPSGGTLNITGGSYTGAFTISKAITLVGGSLTLASGSQALLSITAANVVLDGITMTGAGTGASQNDNASAVWATGATNIEVKNCTITNFKYGGVMLWSTSGGNVHDNYIGQIQPGEASEGNAYGVAFSDFGGTVSSDCVAHANTVEDIPTWQAFNTHNGLRCHWTNNIIRRCRRGIWLASPTGRPDPTDCTVTDNILYSPAGALNPTGIFLLETVNVVVTGNQISLEYNPSGGDYINFVRDYGLASTGYTISGNTTIVP